MSKVSGQRLLCDGARTRWRDRAESGRSKQVFNLFWTPANPNCHRLVIRNVRRRQKYHCSRRERASGVARVAAGGFMAQNSVARASARNPHPVRRLRDCRERARALELPGHRPTLSVRLERLRTSHAIAATGRVYAGRLLGRRREPQARDLRDRQGDSGGEEHVRDGRCLGQRSPDPKSKSTYRPRAV